MQRKSIIQILIYGTILFCTVGIAYFLGDIGFGKSIFEQVSSDFMYKLQLLIWIDIIAIVMGSIYFFKKIANRKSSKENGATCGEKIKILTIGLRKKGTPKKIVICSLVIITALGSGYFVMEKVKENALHEQLVLDFDRAIENLEIAENMTAQAYEEKNEEALVYRIKWFEDAIEKFRTEDLAIAQSIKKENVYNVKLKSYSRLLIQHKMNFEKLTGNKYQAPV